MENSFFHSKLYHERFEFPQGPWIQHIDTALLFCSILLTESSSLFSSSTSSFCSLFRAASTNQSRRCVREKSTGRFFNRLFHTIRRFDLWRSISGAPLRACRLVFYITHTFYWPLTLNTTHSTHIYVEPRWSIEKVKWLSTWSEPRRHRHYASHSLPARCYDVKVD